MIQDQYQVVLPFLSSLSNEEIEKILESNFDMTNHPLIAKWRGICMCACALTGYHLHGLIFFCNPRTVRVLKVLAEGMRYSLDSITLYECMDFFEILSCSLESACEMWQQHSNDRSSIPFVLHPKGNTELFTLVLEGFFGAVALCIQKEKLAEREVSCLDLEEKANG